MARRPGRTAAARAVAAIKNTPQTLEEAEALDDQDEDHEPEGNADQEMEDVGTPQDGQEDDDEEARQDDGEGGDDGDDNDGTPARDSDAQSQPGTPRSTAQIVRRRKPGRPTKFPRLDNGSDSEARGTPKRRGRGGALRGRWANRNKGGPSQVSKQPIDNDGTLLDVINDEVDLPEDPKGPGKVDALGVLQDGREYRVRTFKILGLGDRLYMLSTEPARAMGFRDSYLFFAKHKRLFKKIVDDVQKKDLIDRSIIPHSYKGRAIGVVTARSVYREFGARMLIRGRRVIDDFEEQAARDEGHVEGELADPNDVIKEGEAYNRNQYVAWHGASAVYHQGAPSVPTSNKHFIDVKKRRNIVSEVNWMSEHAAEASRFNSSLTQNRKRLRTGHYDINTNSIFFPASFQPSHARWEQVNDIATSSREDVSESETINAAQVAKSIFPTVEPRHSNHFLIVDTIFENAPNSGLGIPGIDGNDRDLESNGLSTIPAELRDLLPEDCRKAFDEALRKEQAWKTKWSTDSSDHARRPLIIDKGLLGI